MNIQIREYLIDQCRIGKPIFYEDIAKKLNLNLSLEIDRITLSKTIGDISVYEYSKKRPLVSSVAIYKTQNEHGNGFYKLCETLGLGKASELKDLFFGFAEFEKAKIFWTNEYHYQHFYKIEDSIFNDKDNPFFNSDEIIFFGKWANKIYDKKNIEHITAKEFLLESVWQKTKFWSDEVVKRLSNWECSNKRIWTKRSWDNGGIAAAFKPYTWARIYKKGNLDKEIFFTIGIDAECQAIFYKLDYYFEDGYKLTDIQKDLCIKHIPNHLKWKTIEIDDFNNWNWEKLISFIVDYISCNSHHYDKLIELVWGENITDVVFRNHLTKRCTPINGYSNIPIPKPKFMGYETDYIKKNSNDKSLGNAGEDLVINYEKNYLINKGLNKLADKVCKRKDGEGYDILSFDENSLEKYIEVKTTKGDEFTPFIITLNEKLFSEQNIGKYCIYRLYNFNEENNTSDFYEISYLDTELMLQPIEYRAYLKKK